MMDDKAYKYARNLLFEICRRDCPEKEVQALDDTIGVLTQIDHMTAHLFSRIEAQAAQIEGLESKLIAAMRREETAWQEANHARAKVRGWEATVVVRNLPQLSIPVTDWGPGQGEQTAIPHITPERLTDILDKLTAAEAAIAAEKAKLAVAVEAADYLLHAVDDLMDGPAYPITDVHLMVEEGAKIQSVADARAAIEEVKK